MEAVLEPSLLPGILAQPRPAGWEALRSGAEALLAGQDWPTTRLESWRYTDLAGLKALPFAPAAPAAVDLTPLILPEARGSRLVFVNGHYDSHLSCLSNLPPGVRVLNLAAATELAHELGSIINEGGPSARDARSTSPLVLPHDLPGQSPVKSCPKIDPFTLLNTARFRDGALVIVPKGVRVEAPIHVLFVSTQDGGEPVCTLPRLFVVVERNASATLVEEYQGRGRYLTCAVGEVIVRENASLSHTRIQRESAEAFHLSALAARVGKDARYDGLTVTFGARLARTTPRVELVAEGASLTLDGLALLGESQLADTHSFIDHLVPHCTSRQTHKSIADGRAQSVFNGIIYVRKDAQGTDAQQQCRGLLLSSQAKVDAMPQLEIYADDVKCAHGAAIGQLDADALFYLQSRGLRPALARNLLTYAFASDLLAGIPLPSLRRQLRATVLALTNAENLEALP